LPRRNPVDERDRFVSEAAEHGRCTKSEDFRKGNAAFDATTAAAAELRRRDDRGPNDWVKLAAATHLLSSRPEVASELLGKLESGPQGYVEFGAKIVLRE
jgi:hypothetical protein